MLPVGRTAFSLHCVLHGHCGTEYLQRRSYEEKHDKGSFVKNIISDNILLGDIYVRAKELHVTTEVPRGVFVLRQLDKSDSSLIDQVQSLFPDRQNDFVLNIGEADVALIKQLSEGAGENELDKIAAQIDDTVNHGNRVMIGIGTVAQPPARSGQIL